MALTYRSIKGSALTNLELDNNFRHFTGSHSITGSISVTGDINAATGSITGEFNRIRWFNHDKRFRCIR